MIAMTDETGEPKVTPLPGDKEAVLTLTKPHQPSALIKYGSLLTLTAINSASTLSLRHSQIRTGDKFVSSSVVVMAEVVKLAISLCLVAFEDRNLSGVYRTVVKRPLDTLKMCLPSLLYVVHNNLLYVGARHLDASTFLVTCRLKILTTALFACIMLKQTFRPLQLLSLATLIGGVVLVQLAQTTETNAVAVATTQNRLIGFAALSGASVLSGCSSIYFEKILKGSDVSVWMRNVQLSSISLPLSLATCLGSSWSQIVGDGFFFGYDWFVLWLILTQSGGGLTVAVVIKYADSILKCFASSMSIVIASVASIFLFGLQVTWMFSAGVAIVIASVFMYNYKQFDCGGDKGVAVEEQATSTESQAACNPTGGWSSITGLFRRASVKNPDPNTTGADQPTVV